MPEDRKSKAIYFQMPETKQTCKHCGVPILFDFAVSDELWSQVAPLEFEQKALCLNCFLYFAKEKGVSVTTDDFKELFVQQESRLNFERLPRMILLMDSYVSLTGGYVEDEKEHGDHDIVVRDESLSDSAKIKIVKALQKADMGKDSVHLILNPQGAQKDFIPLYDLALVRRDEEEISKVRKIEEDALSESAEDSAIAGVSRENRADAMPNLAPDVLQLSGDSHLLVKVLGKTKTKDGNWVYRCGLKDGEEIGETLATKLDVPVGALLEVGVFEVQVEDEDGKPRVSWQGPCVKGMAEDAKEASDLDYVKSVAELLSARESLQEAIRQPFGSPGGKRLLAGIIVQLIPEHKTYVEPFAGGAAIFWKKEPSENEVLNDIDPEIAAAYRILKKFPPEEIRKALDNFDWKPLEERYRQYLRGGGEDTPNRLCKFLYTARHSFAGQRGENNYKSSVEAQPPNLAPLDEWHERLQNVRVLNQDFRKVISDYDKAGTFFYLDPPYEGKQGVHYGGKSHTIEIEKLYSAIKGIKNAKWLLSNADVAEIRKAFSAYNIRQIPTTKFFHQDTQGDAGKELLIANYDFRLPPGTLNRYESQHEAKPLSDKGEQTGEARLDFMKEKPYILPGEFTAWRHWRGLDREDVSKSELALFRSLTSASVHIDLRCHWGKDYLEGFTLFTPGNNDLREDKLFSGLGKDKIASTLKQRQPLTWGEPKELDERVFEPGDVGNVTGKETYGKMFLVDSGLYLPCRIRNEKDKRYYEFALRFKDNTRLNGIWAISEEAAAAAEGVPFLIFRLDTKEPFWLRHAEEEKYEAEIASMQDWEKPTQEQIEKFLKP